MGTKRIHEPWYITYWFLNTLRLIYDMANSYCGWKWIEEFLHHLGWLKPYKQWDVYHRFQLVRDFATIHSRTLTNQRRTLGYTHWCRRDARALASGTCLECPAELGVWSSVQLSSRVNPLVFWYQYEYLRSPAKKMWFFARYLADWPCHRQ